MASFATSTQLADYDARRHLERNVNFLQYHFTYRNRCLLTSSQRCGRESNDCFNQNQFSSPPSKRKSFRWRVSGISPPANAVTQI